MKKKAEITPLPWHVSWSSVLSDKPILVSVCSGDDMPQARANAAYIVRACNNYPKLVELVRQIIANRSNCFIPENGDKAKGLTVDWTERAETVLTAAEGE